MITGRKFVWMHFPKTGGHAVAAAIQQSASRWRPVRADTADLGWHDNVAARSLRDPSFDVASKKVICGFRRLPYWILSRIYFEAARRPHRVATRQMLCRGQFLEDDGDAKSADEYLGFYLAPRVDRWVRMENMAQDYIAAFNDIFGARRAAKGSAVLGEIVNASPTPYLKALEFYFTPPELAALYDANPSWAALEKTLYGDVLRIGPTCHKQVDSAVASVRPPGDRRSQVSEDATLHAGQVASRGVLSPPHGP